MNDENLWKKKLTKEQYRVLREKGTEAPGSGVYLHHDKNGDYTCAGCDQVLFSSKDKYDSITPGLIGWPSFNKAKDSKVIKLVPDTSLGMVRTEVVCSKCGGHLGHVFDDELSPGGVHYCINSAALGFCEVKSKDNKQ